MLVETKKILIDSKLECASGEALESFELMTDFYGELNEKKDNAVLVCHAFSSKSLPNLFAAEGVYLIERK